MSLLVVGLSHRSAPLPVLEAVSADADAVAKLLQDVAASPSVAEAMVRALGHVPAPREATGEEQAVRVMEAYRRGGITAAREVRRSLPGADKRLLQMHALVAAMQQRWRAIGGIEQVPEGAVQNIVDVNIPCLKIGIVQRLILLAECAHRLLPGPFCAALLFTQRLFQLFHQLRIIEQGLVAGENGGNIVSVFFGRQRREAREIV